MHRGSRISVLLLAGTLLASTASAALAQSNVVAPPPPPREGTVGPEQLRDFSLGGPKPQADTDQASPAETAPQPTVSQRPPAPAQQPAAPATSTPPRTSVPTGSPQQPVASPNAGAAAAAPAQGRTAAAPQVSVGLPPATPAPTTSYDFSTGASPASSGIDTAPLTPPDRSLPLWPWLLALTFLAAGGLILFFRRRSAQVSAAPGVGTLAFAGGAPPSDSAARPKPSAPAPAPTPAPRAAAKPSPRPAAADRPPAPAFTPPPPAAPTPAFAPAPSAAPVPGHPKGVGIVSTRLRPWLDLDIRVAAAVLTEEELQLHLDLLVTNSGSTPARSIGVEAVALNAGPDQDADLAAYFARPDPDPRAADMIAPLEDLALQTIVRMPRAAFREYAAAGGRVVVPLVALNAGYRAGSNVGRTSAAFLIGRGTPDSEKLGPLRTDQGPRQFSGVIARRTNLGVRR